MRDEVKSRPMLSLGFPNGMLFDLMMRGGPLPDRYQHLRAALVNAGHLDFEPEEAVVMREWFSQQPDDVIDVPARDASVELVNKALRRAGLCSVCGGAFIVEDQHGEPRCGRCGELPED
jgi:ribosomal protein S27AE